MNETTKIRGQPPRRGKPFVYQHLVTLEDTNVVGNVYFSHHVSWQGRCRELFLRTYAPEIVAALRENLRLVTLQVSCEYYEELQALDEVEIRMRLAHLRQHKIGLDFEYIVRAGDRESLVARGFQEVGCMAATHEGLRPISPPPILARALDQFSHA